MKAGRKVTIYNSQEANLKSDMAMTDQKRRKHQYYLQRGYYLRPFVYVQWPFTDSEKALIRQYGQWMMALERGYITPLTEAQEHFVRACKGEVSPITIYENVWLRYTNAVEAEKAEVAGRKAAEREWGKLENDEAQSDCIPCNGYGTELSHGVTTGLRCSYCGGSGTDQRSELPYYDLDPVA